MESGLLVASGPLRARGGSLRPLCRNFARGFCRWGPSCRFSHDTKAAHTCRYFQSGFCSYGEQCSYEHTQEEPVPAGTHCGPRPTLPHGHRGSELSHVPVAQGWRGAQHSSAHPVPSVTHMAFKFTSMELGEEKKDKNNIATPYDVPCGAIGGALVPTRAQDASARAVESSPQQKLFQGSQLQGLGLNPNFSDSREAAVETATWTDPPEIPMEPGAAAAPVSTAELRARSKAIVCGICMDRVYEKPLPEERVFGILPNCSHAYCLSCIRKWRGSRDFQNTVIKACPECRVTSGYYIPHKYWVSDTREKEKLIEAFKARMGKIRCKFFVRNRGRCPFKSDCIYLHELPARRPPRHRRQQPRMPAEISSSPLESSDEEDEELCVLKWALTLADTGFRYLHFGHEILFTDFSDSD